MAGSFNCSADPNRALPQTHTFKKVDIFTPLINFDKEQASPMDNTLVTAILQKLFFTAFAFLQEYFYINYSQLSLIQTAVE